MLHVCLSGIVHMFICLLHVCLHIDTHMRVYVQEYEHQQLRFRNQLNAIMNRNDETKLLTESEKEARTAARTARHRRPDIDAFKCMKHIIEETNRYNISAVAAALHSYIRMTIEKI